MIASRPRHPVLSIGIMTLTRPFGTDGPEVSILGQGTWQLEREPRAALRALRQGLDLGLGHIDTAAIYGDGAAERLVGRALRGRRDEAFLVSKVNPQQATRRGTIAACDESLRRLGTDYLDAYLLHWVGPHPLEDTIEAFEALVAAGKIRHWGVSNFDEAKLAEALAIAGAGRIACNQVLYHLQQRSIEHAVLPFCQRHGIALVAYSPFGAGAFVTAGTSAARVLGDVADAHGATPRQVALAFLSRQPGTFVIPKAVTAGHVEDNASAGRLTFSEDDLAALEAAFPLGERTWGVPML
jgi:diketogulonate reductase-like aldo/keto reductase